MKVKVHVTQETSFDFTPAEAYGEVEFLTHRDLNSIKSSPGNVHTLREINHKLKAVDFDIDYFVLTGSPYIMASVFLLIGNRGIKKVKILRWDNRDHKYTPMEIDLPVTVTL